MLKVIEGKGNESVDTKSVVRYLGERTNGEFDALRSQKEYDRMVDKVEEIRSEPFYRWPDNK